MRSGPERSACVDLDGSPPAILVDPLDIQVGSEKKTYRMREASEAEEAELWPKLEVMYPDYREYRARTDGVRRIPVLIFSPV